MDKQKVIEKIKKLKKEKDAVILAHNYQPAYIQDIADFVGDSFALKSLMLRKLRKAFSED